MPLTPCNTNKNRLLEAWEGVSPDEGVTTRGRASRIKSASSQSPLQSSEEVLISMENTLQPVQQGLSPQEDNVLVRPPSLSKDKENEGDVGAMDSAIKPDVTPKQQCRSPEHAVTTCEQNVSSLSTAILSHHESTSDSTTDEEFQKHEDGGELQVNSVTPHDQKSSSSSESPEHRTDLLRQEHWDSQAVLESGMTAQMPSPLTAVKSLTTNIVHTLPDNSSDSDPKGSPASEEDNSLDSDLKSSPASEDNFLDSDMEEDVSSDITATSGQEAIDQLRAVNEDLRSENKYYRLMSEITMKTVALRRGYMRTAIQPSSLSPQLYNLHQILMSDGLKLPDSASDRAHVLADVIELHLTWEVQNLKHSISASAAVNNFVDFAGLFLPQIQTLAIGEFVGGEDTEEVRAEISIVVLKLVCWIVEQLIELAESVAPQYVPHQVAGWYDEGVKALWNLDTCLEAAWQRRLQCFPESKMPGSQTEPPGLYSPRIMNWAYSQLTGVNRVAGRLQRKVGMVPNHYGVLVDLFGLTRQSMKNYIRHGQTQIQVARQLKEVEQARARAMGQGKGRA